MSAHAGPPSGVVFSVSAFASACVESITNEHNHGLPYNFPERIRPHDVPPPWGVAVQQNPTETLRSRTEWRSRPRYDVSEYHCDPISDGLREEHRSSILGS